MVNMSFAGIMALQALYQSVCAVTGGIIAIGGVVSRDLGGIHATAVGLAVCRHVVVATDTPPLLSRLEGAISLIDAILPVVLGPH
jgi:hypothetical protein